MNSVWIIIAFIIYLAAMLGIGAIFYKKNETISDYFLGGRGLGGWVAAMSAQASDMSGWLLMGLPGAIYAAGTGQLWIGVGLAIGTYLNWRLVSRRLRNYTIVAGDSLTLPQFFENRFRDGSRVLRVASSIVIIVFFLVYTASGFAAGAKLFQTVFNLNYTLALTIGVVVILSYTFMGGFLAVCWTDFVQGLLMLFAIVSVPLAVFVVMGGIDSSAFPQNFLNPMQAGGQPITFISIISQLAWGLGYFGMPHILVRFMAIKSDAEVIKSRRIATVWVIFSLAAAVFVGLLGRGYIKPELVGPDSEKVFINMIIQLLGVRDPGNFFLMTFIAGILLCAILAAIMSTADSQLLVTASSVSGDIYKGVVKKNASEKELVWVSRMAVIAVAVIAYIIALNPGSSVMGLVSNAWAGFGAAFGPVVLCALFWRRTTTNGAASGMIAGGLTIVLWDYIPFGGKTIASMSGLYSLVPGFAIALVCIVAVSLMTQAPSNEILREFDLVASGDIHNKRGLR